MVISRTRWILRVRWFGMGAPPWGGDLPPYYFTVAPIYETSPKLKDKAVQIDEGHLPGKGSFAEG